MPLPPGTIGLNEPTPRNEVSTFELTIAEHFESDQPLIKAELVSLDLTKNVFCSPGGG